MLIKHVFRVFMDAIVVYITSPNEEEAARIARTVV